MGLAQERSSPKAETLEGRTSGLLFVFGPRPSILRRVINYSLATEGTQGFSKPMEEILTDRVKGVGLELLTESIASCAMEQDGDPHASEKARGWGTPLSPVETREPACGLNGGILQNV